MSPLSRRELLAGGAGLALAASLVRGRESPAKPNILFIVADDMGYADLSCYGRQDYRTPRLDQLARQGLMMTSGYANSAVCSASRTALITGRYQYRLNVGLYEPGGMTADYGIPDGHPTLPGLLKQQGYHTSLIGKWHLGEPPKYSPIHRGYDYFFGFMSGAMDYFRVGGSRGGRGPGLSGDAARAAGDGCTLAGATTARGRGPGPGPAGPPMGGPPGPGMNIGDAMADGLYENDTRVQVPGYLTHLFADRAVQQVQKGAATGEPFFISLHFNAPHWPWEGPNDEQASAAIMNPFHVDGGSIRKYGEMVVAMDESIGRVLDAIRRAGVERDTIVVFTSDNGGERFSNDWPFIGSKGELLEGGLRIPLIVRWPGHIKAGSRSDQQFMHMDWLPTLLAAAGGAPDPAWPSDGMNLLPVLRGQQQPMPRKLYWRYKAMEQAAIRDGDWKYLKIGEREYLFNISEDERERANKRYRQPEIFARLKADWAAWNATMLPYPERMASDNPKLSHCWADHY